MTARKKRLSSYILLVLAASVVVAIHMSPGLDSSRLEDAIRNSLHIVVFGGLTALIYALLPLKTAIRVPLAFVIAVSVGILAEIAQSATGKSADIHDIYRDAFGAAMILAAIGVFRFSASFETRSHSKRLVFFMGLVLCGAVAAPLAYWIAAFVFERSQHPVVIDFDSRFSKYRYFPINSEIRLIDAGHGNGGELAADVILSKRPRSGIAVQTAMYDWSSYKSLVVTGQLVGASQGKFTVHLNDERSIGHFADTQSGTILVSDERQSYRLPIRSILREAGRGDEISDIRQVVLLARSRTAGAHFRLDEVRLEP
jgi:VanZ family protein